MRRRDPRSGRWNARLAVEGLEARALLTASHAIVSELATTPPVITSTVPPNGDINPYGVAIVPSGFAKGGLIHPGDVLVSNFNASSNLQGTGSTIVRITPGGTPSVFYQGPSGVGLSTALGVLRAGFVVIGNLPTTDGSSATAQQGSLIVLDRNGQKVAEFTDPTLLDGPWDLTVNDRGDHAQVFVADVLSGTISRFDVSIGRSGVKLDRAVQIGSGYTHHGDPAAFEVGPTGLAFDARRDILYVASTGDNAIDAIHDAGVTRHDHQTGQVLTANPIHLHGPLGLTLAPNGDVIIADGDAVNPDPDHQSELVEYNRRGRFVAEFSISPNPGGAFGVASIRSGARSTVFAAVNDIDNTVEVWTVKT